MQIFKIRFLLVLLALNFAGLNAQTYSLKDISSFYSGSIKAIMNGTEVGGYVIFYKTDKADRKNDNYRLELLDEKLAKVNTVKLTLPHNVMLMQPTFNGEALGLMFYEPRKGNYIFKSYDKVLKPLGSHTDEDVHKYERAGIEQMDAEGASTYYGLQALTGKGFVRAGYGDSKDQFRIDCFDNAFKKKWEYETPKDAKDFETFIMSGINEKYVTGTIIRRKGLMSKKLDYFLAAFDAETGKKLLDVSVEKSGEQLSITATNLTEGADEVTVQGEYYDEDDKPGVNKSKGFYLKTYDLKTGKPTRDKFFSWAKDINKLFDKAGKESIEDKYLNYPQAMFKAANGHSFIIFEQFKKAADAGGIAMNVLSAASGGGGGAASNVKVKVGNIWIIELDAELKPIGIKYLEKDGSDVALPPGSGMMGAGLLGYFVKGIGGFDYQFMTRSNDNNTFNAAYINYDREKGEKTKVIVGNLFLAKDGSLNFDKVDLTAPRKSRMYLYRAQGQNIMLSTYNWKEDTLELKLVKLNY